MSNEIERAGHGAGMTTAQGVGGAAITKSGETSSSAAAAMAKASVEARFLVARARPRDEDTARVRILRECERPHFAELAEYELPRGGKSITGPTIRFAEGLARHFGNLTIESVVTYEDADTRLVRCTVTDLETNSTYSADVAIEKTIERKHAKPMDEILGTRVTSTGGSVYIIRAGDADLLAKHNGQVSRAIRTLILRLIPGDIVDEALAATRSTIERGDSADPDAAKKRTIDAFAKIGVMPAQLADALGHPIASVSPVELGQLRRWYASIRDGEATIGEIVASTRPKADEDASKASSTSASKIKSAARATSGKADEDASKKAAEEKAIADERAAAVARGESPDR